MSLVHEIYLCMSVSSRLVGFFYLLFTSRTAVPAVLREVEFAVVDLYYDEEGDDTQQGNTVVCSCC